VPTVLCACCAPHGLGLLGVMSGEQGGQGVARLGLDVLASGAPCPWGTTRVRRPLTPRPAPGTQTPWAVSPANFLTTPWGGGELNHKYLTFIFFYLNLSKPAG
jgi:hypothetical protein